MDTLVQEGKYQVLEVLEKQDGYRACLCIDVETNNHYRPMIFNIYEKDEYIRRYLPAFFSMSHEGNSDFIRVLSGRHCITAVFEHHTGVKLRSYFKQADKNDFGLRCRYASMLLEECLILDAAADFISYSCLEPDNIVVSDKLQKVRINYIVRPGETINSNYKGEKLALLLEQIFAANRYVPEGLFEYIVELKRGIYESIVTAFSRWKEIQEDLMDEHRNLRKETLATYLVRRIKSFFRNRLG